MKIGINRWTMPPEWSLAECFKAAKTAGFDSIEVNIAETGELALTSTEAAVRGLADSAHAAGITLSSLSSGLGWKYPLTANDPDVRRRGIEVVRAALQAARWLDVDTVLCVPGIVSADIRYDVAYERSQAALRELAPEAEASGVFIGVENVWNKFLLSPLEMARFVDEVNSPWVGVYFDAGNILSYGYPQHWIEILGPRIKKVHVKDFKAEIGSIQGFANPLQGDVPWAAVRAALDGIGYGGFVTAEVSGYPAAPELGLRHIAESLRQFFG